MLTVVGSSRIWQLGEHSPGIDFYQFWVVAEVAGRDDVGDIYGEADRTRLGQEFQRRAVSDEDSVLRRAAAKLWPRLTPLGTPFLYASFRPLAGGSYDDALRRFRIVCMVSLFAGVALLARVLRLSLAATLVVLAVLTTIFEPVRADVRVGNVNQLQLAMLAVVLWLGSRPDHSRFQLAAGAALALAVAFKPNLALIVPLLMLSWALEGRSVRLRLQASGMVAGALFAFAAGVVVFRSLHVWRDWLRIVTTMPPSMIPLSAGNFGLDRILYERFGIEAGLYLAIATTGAIAASLWMRFRRRRRRALRGSAVPTADAALVGAGCLAYMLSASMVWLHYFLLALPAALVVMTTRREGIDGAAGRIVAAIGLAAIAIDPALELAAANDLSGQAAIASAGLLLLFTATLREIAGPA